MKLLQALRHRADLAEINEEKVCLQPSMVRLLVDQIEDYQGRGADLPLDSSIVDL